jgi:hypothetical protein
MYLIGHQGWTDFMSQFGLYVHFANLHGKGTILVVDPGQLPFVRRLAVGTNLSVELLETTEEGTGVCVLCHQIGHPIRCPRTGTCRCKYPSSRYGSIQGLCVFDDPVQWGLVHSKTLEQGKSFVEAFYAYHNLPIETLWTQFTVTRIPEEELAVPTEAPYLTYHMQPGVPIRLNNLRKDLQQVPLDRRSPDFFGCLRILENATEIHLVQSSYCMFVYLLQLKTGLFSDKPIFVHTYSRPNANTDYRNMNRHPQLPNWTFL